MLADDANLVRDEVGAVEADAEPARDGDWAGHSVGGPQDTHGQGRGLPEKACNGAPRQDLKFNYPCALLRTESVNQTVASQKLADHGDVAASCHGLPWDSSAKLVSAGVFDMELGHIAPPGRFGQNILPAPSSPGLHEGFGARLGLSMESGSSGAARVWSRVLLLRSIQFCNKQASA